MLRGEVYFNQQLKEVVQNPKVFAQVYDGYQVRIGERSPYPGWVINGRLEDKNWRLLKGRIVPVRPRALWTPSSMRARQEQSRIKELYAGEVISILAHEDEGWVLGVVSENDLHQSEEFLVDQQLDAISRGNTLDTKRFEAAYLAVTGLPDLK